MTDIQIEVIAKNDKFWDDHFGFSIFDYLGFGRALLEASAKPTEPTIEEIELMAKGMCQKGELNWAGFRKDSDGFYTIPEISISEYKLILGGLKTFSVQA